jgi:hypothetical protein
MLRRHFADSLFDACDNAFERRLQWRGFDTQVTGGQVCEYPEHGHQQPSGSHRGGNRDRS